MPNVLIPLAEGFEEMEAVTMADILRRAQFSVTLAGLTPGPVTGARGTVIVPDAALDEILKEEFDLIALPGGQPGVNNLKADSRILALLQRMTKAGKITAAICAAPLVLADAGLMEGKNATAYPGTLENLDIKDLTLDDSAVVEDGALITSRGPGTAIAFSLALVQRLAGEALRQKVAAGLQQD